MTKPELIATIDELDDLLEAERAALLNGDVEGLSRLHDRKAELVDALSGSPVRHSQDLDMLNKKAARNQVLLDSAMAGIRSVSRRLATIRRVRQSLDTYDEQGQKNSVDLNVDRSVEKRA